jgi:hypothetical protein
MIRIDNAIDVCHGNIHGISLYDGIRKPRGEVATEIQ